MGELVRGHEARVVEEGRGSYRVIEGGREEGVQGLRGREKCIMGRAKGGPLPSISLTR